MQLEPSAGLKAAWLTLGIHSVQYHIWVFSISGGIKIQPQMTKTSNSKNGAVFLDDLSILVHFALLIESSAWELNWIHVPENSEKLMG